MGGDKVSVIVPVYDTEKYIAACLDSVLGQTHPNVELIVVYDESPDNTLKVLRNYRSRIKLTEKKKTNIATARNVGLREASGKYITICEADDLFAPSKLERQVVTLEQNRDVGLVYTDYYQIDSSGKIIGSIRCPEWNRRNRRKWLYHRFINICSVMIRKQVVDAAGEFDENLQHADDFDYLIRLSKITKFKRIPEFLTYKRYHSEQVTITKRNELDKYRVKIFKKHKLMGPYLHQAVHNPIWIIKNEVKEILKGPTLLK